MVNRLPLDLDWADLDLRIWLCRLLWGGVGGRFCCELLRERGSFDSVVLEDNIVSGVALIRFPWWLLGGGGGFLSLERLEVRMPWSCSADIVPIILVVPILLVDCMLDSALLNVTAWGEGDDPSDGVWCGADPTDPRGRSSRAELPLLPDLLLLSPSLSLADESGLKGSAA